MLYFGRSNGAALGARSNSEMRQRFGDRFFKLAAPLERVPTWPTGPEASVQILCRFIDQIVKLDRYEAQQLSRRRAASRALDALQATRANKTS